MYVVVFLVYFYIFLLQKKKKKTTQPSPTVEMPSGLTRSRGRYTFKMFNIAHLQSLTPIDGGAADASFIDQFKSGDLPKINTQKIQERATTAREKRAANMGTDVSIEGQDVFDSISRTYVYERSFILITSLFSTNVNVKKGGRCFFFYGFSYGFFFIKKKTNKNSLKCIWDGSTIVVLDVVTIAPPYGTDSVC